MTRVGGSRLISNEALVLVSYCVFYKFVLTLGWFVLESMTTKVLDLEGNMTGKSW